MTPARFCITTSPITPDDEIATMLILAEMVVRDNFAWMLAQQDLGIEVPCCASCAGVRYVPPSEAEYRNANITIDGAQTLLRKKRGACGSVAAYDAAAKWLDAYNAGVSPAQLPALASVAIVPQGDSYYHAVIQTPEGLEDPTAKMQQGKGCSGEKGCACSAQS